MPPREVSPAERVGQRLVAGVEELVVREYILPVSHNLRPR